VSQEKRHKEKAASEQGISKGKVAPASFDEFLAWIHQEPAATAKFGTHDLGGYHGIQIGEDFRVRTVDGVSFIIADDAGFTKLEHVKRELAKCFPEDAFEIQTKDKRYAIVLKGQK
jgi:hypothetical protein